MKKIEVSEIELDKILKFKGEKASWLKIERETGIERRIAKRAYEEWNRATPKAWGDARMRLNEILGRAIRVLEAEHLLEIEITVTGIHIRLKK